MIFSKVLLPFAAIGFAVAMPTEVTEVTEVAAREESEIAARASWVGSLPYLHLTSPYFYTLSPSPKIHLSQINPLTLTGKKTDSKGLQKHQLRRNARLHLHWHQLQGHNQIQFQLPSQERATAARRKLQHGPQPQGCVSVLCV